MDLDKTNEREEAHRIDLLQGRGGIYGVQDLQARGALLQFLAASIDLMHDELEALIQALLLGDPEET